MDRRLAVRPGLRLAGILGVAAGITVVAALALARRSEPERPTRPDLEERRNELIKLGEARREIIKLEAQIKAADEQLQNSILPGIEVDLDHDRATARPLADLEAEHQRQRAEREVNILRTKLDHKALIREAKIELTREELITLDAKAREVERELASTRRRDDRTMLRDALADLTERRQMLVTALQDLETQ